MGISKCCRKQSILSIINLVACLYCVLWMINPVSNNIYTIGVAVLVWLLSAFLLNGKTLYNIMLNRKSFLIWLWPLVMAFYSLAGHMNFSFAYFIYIFIGFMIPFYVFDRNEFACRMIAIIGIGYSILISIITLYAYRTFPAISRVLSYGSDDLISAQGGLMYKTPFVAGYKNIYMLIFLVVAIGAVYKQINSKPLKALCGVLCLLFIINIIFGQFSIALIILFVGIYGCFVYVQENSRKRLFWCVMAILGGMVVLLCIKPVLLFLAGIFGGNIATHFKDLVSFLEGSGGVGLTLDRVYVYRLSIESFFNNPLFGAGTLDALYVSNGNHSSILDSFARFGIFGAVSYFYTFFVPYRLNKKALGEKFQRLYCWLFVLFMLSALFNTMFNYQTLCTIFILVPAFLISIDKEINIGR